MHSSSSAPDPSPAGVGDRAPDFAFPDGARTRRLAELRGSAVVLVFHPTRWDPARAEYVNAYNRLVMRLPGAAGVQLLAMSGSGTRCELTFADATLDVPLLATDRDAAARLYGVADGGAVLVIGADGVVRWRHDASDSLGSLDAAAQALVALSVGGDSGPSAASEPLSDASHGRWSRREFVATALGVAAAALLAPHAARAATAADRLATAVREAQGAVPITLRVNGRDLALRIEPRVTLLDALREYAGLTGTKKGCDHGQCGACTVHVNGKRVLSCLTLAMMTQGQQITTIEGLAGAAGNSGALHPMQQAFIAHDGFQCGYCTPGQIMSAVAVTKEPWGPPDADVREAMSGNICRCGAYPGIVAAVQQVRQQQSPATGSDR